MESYGRIFSKDEVEVGAEEDGEAVIGYIWIGPPPPSKRTQTTQGLQIPQHDIGGISQMAKKNKKNPLVFWCLKDHMAHYQAAYKGTRITVRCIEDDIEEKLRSENENVQGMALALQSIIEKCLKDPARNKIRDRVTVKDFFSFYLHATTNGSIFTFDTGIFPEDTARSIYFAKDKKFMAPFINEHDSHDIWLLFSSSPKSKDISKEAFIAMFAEWCKLEDKYANDLRTLYEWTETLGQKAIDIIDKHSFNDNVNTIFTFQDAKGITKQSAINVTFAVHTNGTFSKTQTSKEPVIVCKKVYNNTHKLANVLPAAGTETRQEKKTKERFRPPVHQDNDAPRMISENKYREWCQCIKTVIEAYFFGSFGPRGGDPIIVKGKEKIVPKHAHSQWNKIAIALDEIEDSDDNEQWSQIYSEVVKIGTEAHNKAPRGLFGFGERSPQTKKYYEVFTKAPTRSTDFDGKFIELLNELMNSNKESPEMGPGKRAPS